MEIDTKKSLDEIEGTEWVESEFGSHLVVTWHELRKKPIEQFTIEDLRMMIGLPNLLIIWAHSYVDNAA